MDSKDSSTCLTSQQLTIREEGQTVPLLLVPCNAEDKVCVCVSVCKQLKMFLSSLSPGDLVLPFESGQSWR